VVIGLILTSPKTQKKPEKFGILCQVSTVSVLSLTQKSQLKLILKYQFTKVWQQFYELKTKPYKGFKNTKWLRYFVFLYYNINY
jgi:hypothetical protein